MTDQDKKWREVVEGVEGVSTADVTIVCWCANGATMYLSDETPTECPECGRQYRLIYRVEVLE